MFTSVFTTSEPGSATYISNVEMWISGAREVFKAEWSKASISIQIKSGRNIVAEFTPSQNPTSREVENEIIKHCAVQYHGMPSDLVDIVIERRDLQDQGRASSSQSGLLTRALENKLNALKGYWFDAFSIARAGDRRYFRYALDEMPKPQMWQKADRDGTLRYHQNVTPDTLVNIARNTKSNELPGNNFSATLGEAINSGWLSTDGGTMSYTVSIHPRHQDAYMNDQLVAVSKNKKYWTQWEIIEEINFGDYE